MATPGDGRGCRYNSQSGKVEVNIPYTRHELEKLSGQEIRQYLRCLVKNLQNATPVGEETSPEKKKAKKKKGKKPQRRHCATGREDLQGGVDDKVRCEMENEVDEMIGKMLEEGNSRENTRCYYDRISHRNDEDRRYMEAISKHTKTTFFNKSDETTKLSSTKKSCEMRTPSSKKSRETKEVRRVRSATSSECGFETQGRGPRPNTFQIDAKEALVVAEIADWYLSNTNDPDELKRLFNDSMVQLPTSQQGKAPAATKSAMKGRARSVPPSKAPKPTAKGSLTGCKAPTASLPGSPTKYPSNDNVPCQACCNSPGPMWFFLPLILQAGLIYAASAYEVL